MRLARRELRGGLKGFRVFVACLALGVAAIAGVGSVSLAVQRGIAADARPILGGDVEISQRLYPVAEDATAWLDRHGALSSTTEMRAMARPARASSGAADARPVLVELKAVDSTYPLYGAMTLAPTMSLAEALAERDGVFGAAVDSGVLRRLDLDLGDRLRLGETEFELRATIEHEPDRGTSAFTLGPRAMVAAEALAATELVRPGSLVRYNHRVRLAEGADIDAWTEELHTAFPDAAWRVRGLSDAAPGMRHFLGHVAVYLTLVGFTALLVGGVGVANAVRAHLDAKTATIATYKCLGAPNGLVFRIYLFQILALAALGTIVGLAIGIAIPFALSGILAENLPVAARLAVYPGPVLLAGAFGLLTALTFSLWPLARARRVPGAALFRALVAPPAGRPARRDLLATGACALALIALAVAASDDRVLTAVFCLGAVAALALFRGAAALTATLARRAGAKSAHLAGRPSLRLALANLHRPGAPTASVVVSLGIGLTVLVAVVLVQASVDGQVRERMPDVAPSFFFIDIQPDQVAEFDATVESVPGIERMERVPSLRGRLTRIGGVPVDEAVVDDDVKWVTRSDRGVTYAAEQPETLHLVAGEWWPKDYAGPPLVSFDQRAAEGMGLAVGDAIAVNVLGREFEARIANLREIDWSELGLNFFFVFAPGTFEAAPQTHIATAYTKDPAAEDALERAVADRFANVSAIRVRDALEAITSIMEKVGLAVRATAGVTLLAGVLVLAGAVAAGHRRRVYDAVVLKVLGATRADVLKAYLLEYGLLGLATAAIAAVLGTAAGWALATQTMQIPWRFAPEAVAAVALIATAITLFAGFVGTWRALARKPAPLLRNE
ncbi:MAG: FtsX-like permease family protein [Rhodospirillaceae bacterium]|nr:FtsX-like permease family protein [Rhodospirillaceae bacterium]MBT6117415.1 FtsX-like permease family protein [Rhodospirillaceae bacterium]